VSNGDEYQEDRVELDISLSPHLLSRVSIELAGILYVLLLQRALSIFHLIPPRTENFTEIKGPIE